MTCNLTSFSTTVFQSYQDDGGGGGGGRGLIINPVYNQEKTSAPLEIEHGDNTSACH